MGMGILSLNVANLKLYQYIDRYVLIKTREGKKHKEDLNNSNKKTINHDHGSLEIIVS